MKLTVLLSVLLVSWSVSAQQFKLSPEFKRYSEQDDIPGMVARYKDTKGHAYIIFAEGRNIQAEDLDSALVEGLAIVFRGFNKPVRTKDGFYVSTGELIRSKSKYKFYYIVYVPKTMESYSIFSYETDIKFKDYSAKLLRLIRSDKSMY